MLGSCSNDDVAVTNGTPSVGNGNGLVPVELALNGPSVPSATSKEKKPINGREKSYTF